MTAAELRRVTALERRIAKLERQIATWVRERNQMRHAAPAVAASGLPTLALEYACTLCDLPVPHPGDCCASCYVAEMAQAGTGDA